MEMKGIFRSCFRRGCLLHMSRGGFLENVKGQTPIPPSRLLLPNGTRDYALMVSIQDDKPMEYHDRKRPGARERNHHKIESTLERYSEPFDIGVILQDLSQQMMRKRVDFTVCNLLVHLFEMRNDVKNAWGVLDWMKVRRVPPNGRTYYPLMKMYANLGELAKVREVFEEMKRDPACGQNSYGLLLKIYASLNLVREALQAMDVLKARMEPRTDDYNALLSACAGGQEFGLMWQVYGSMLKDYCKPSVKTYTTLIGNSKLEDLSKVRGVFEEILNQSILTRPHIISLLSSLASRASSYPMAIELFEALSRRTALVPNGFACGIMVRGASLTRNIADARRYFLETCHREKEPKLILVAYTYMFEAYSLAFPISSKASSNCIELSDGASLEFLLGSPPTDPTECAREAFQLLPSLEKVAARSPKASSRPWVAFLAILANYNFVPQAQTYFDTILERFHSHPIHPDLYTCMLEMYARIRNHDTFLDILIKTKSILDPIGNQSHLSDMEKHQYQLSHSLEPIPLRNLYRSIILGLAGFGDLPSSLEYFELLIKDPDWKRDRELYQPYLDFITSSTDPTIQAKLSPLLPKINPN